MLGSTKHGSQRSTQRPAAADFGAASGPQELENEFLEIYNFYSVLGGLHIFDDKLSMTQPQLLKVGPGPDLAAPTDSNTDQ